MANFCQGILKIRGDKKDICNFIENNLTYYPNPNNLNVQLYFKETFENDYEIDYELHWEVRYVHLNNSKRHFIKDNQIIVHNEDDKYWITCVTLTACWDIDIDYLVDISKDYNIDLKIYAFEKGMEFNRDIEVHKGKIIKNKYINFKNYTWECICPTIGG